MFPWILIYVSLFGQKLVEPVVPLAFEGNPGSVYHSVISSEGLFLAQPGTGSVLCFDLKGKSKPSIGRKGQGPGEFNWPCLVYFDAPFLYVADTGQDKIHRIDPKTGRFLKSWRFRGISAFAIRRDQLFVSYIDQPQSHPYGLATLGDDLLFHKKFGEMPCCTDVSGSQKSAVLIAEDGTYWAAFTGEYRVQKFNAAGKLLKNLNEEPVNFVIPAKSKASRFDTASLSENVRSFDKIHGLFETRDRLVLYRYKVRRDAYLDFFSLDGKRVASEKSDYVQPLGVLDGTLYALLSSDEDVSWDFMLVKVILR